MLLLLLLLLLFPLSASAENLGILSANSIDSGSTCNSFGAESPFKPGCINNSSSPYGSSFSNQSAANPLETKTPQFYGLQKKYRDRLSTNPYDPISVSNIYFRYGSHYSSESLNNLYSNLHSARKFYRADSPHQSVWV